MITISAAIQMLSTPDVQTNLALADDLIKQAAEAGAQLIALPENFALMGLNEYDKIAIREQEGHGPIQDFLANTAAKHAVWLVSGTIPLIAENDNKVRASCLIYNDTGERVARYDKIHLFDVQVPNSEDSYRESASIEAGNQPLIIDTPFGRLGIAVCYDLRFPEFSRILSGQKLDILVAPSAFTYETGAAHWEVLLRARAIENLCYVIAPNQGGLLQNGRKTYGHSMIIDPWGVILDCYETGNGVALGNIDLDQLRKTRLAFPVLDHRRFFYS